MSDLFFTCHHGQKVDLSANLIVKPTISTLYHIYKTECILDMRVNWQNDSTNETNADRADESERLLRLRSA